MTYTLIQFLSRAGCLGDVLEAYDATERAYNVSRELLPADLAAKLKQAQMLLFEVRVEIEGPEDEDHGT